MGWMFLCPFLDTNSELEAGPTRQPDKLRRRMVSSICKKMERASERMRERITQYNNMSSKMAESLVRNRVGHSERAVGEWMPSPDEERHKIVPASQLAPK